MTWRKGGCIKTKRRTLAIIVQTPVGTVENGEEGERDITSFSFDFSYILSLHLSLAGYPGLLTWVSLQQPQEQRYPFLTVRTVFSCVQAKVWLPVLGIFNLHTDAMAQEGCTGTVRESALKADPGRKIPCRTRESNLPERRAGPTLYQLIYVS